MAVSYDMATGKYHFELGPPVFQFVNNPGNLNLEVKKMNKKSVGDTAEHFVSDYLTSLGYKCEIHPRTYKVIHLKGGKTIVVSSDNDYHNAFDVKAEGKSYMIYSQVKFMPDGTVSSGHI